MTKIIPDDYNSLNDVLKVGIPDHVVIEGLKHDPGLPRNADHFNLIHQARIRAGEFTQNWSEQGHYIAYVRNNILYANLGPKYPAD